MPLILHNLTYMPALLSALRSARKNIYMSVYVIKGNMKRASDPVTSLLSILEHKVKQGITIKIMLDNPKLNRPNFHPNRFFMRRFYDANIPFCVNLGFTTCHAKVVSIDSSVIFLGSHNLTRRSLANRLDFSIQSFDKIFIANFDKIFLEFWRSGDVTRYPPATLDFDRIYP